MNCDEARDAIALNTTVTDLRLQAHLAQCPRCVSYRASMVKLDRLVPAALRWQAPTNFSAQLMLLAASPALWSSAPLPARPKRWYTVLVYLLTLAIIGISLILAWRAGVFALGQLGVELNIATISAGLARAGTWITDALPGREATLLLLLRLRNVGLWVLAVATVWTMVERRGALFASPMTGAGA